MIDRNQHITKRLKEHYDRVKSLGYEVFCIVVQGSQNYNMDVYTEEYQSDIDTRCIVLPKFEDFVAKKDSVSFTYEFPENKEHIDIKDIEDMFSLWKRSNVQFLEILFSDFYYVPEKYKLTWEKLRANAENFIRQGHQKMLMKAIYGMAMQKFEALTHPYPTIKWKIDKFGYDAKQAHHILRLKEFAERLFISNEKFKDCLVPRPLNRQYLIDLEIKNGLGMSVEEMKQLCKTTCDSIYTTRQLVCNTLDEGCCSKADEWLDNIRIDVLKRWFREELKKEKGRN